MVDGVLFSLCYWVMPNPRGALAHKRRSLCDLVRGCDYNVTDGYGNSRVLKFDKYGNKLLGWGMKGTAGTVRHPAYERNRWRPCICG
jgi:hypothetical protein